MRSARRHSSIRQRKFDVFVNGEVTDKVERLKDKTNLAIAHARPVLMGKLLYECSIERIAALSRRIEQAQNGE
jgi:hypothetical protein